jgi:hypothetical protein
MKTKFSGVMEVSPARFGNKSGCVREGTWRNMGWADILVERDEPRHEETKLVSSVKRFPFGGLESPFPASQTMASSTLLKP